MHIIHAHYIQIYRIYCDVNFVVFNMSQNLKTERNFNINFSEDGLK